MRLRLCLVRLLSLVWFKSKQNDRQEFVVFFWLCARFLRDAREFFCELWIMQIKWNWSDKLTCNDWFKLQPTIDQRRTVRTNVPNDRWRYFLRSMLIRRAFRCSATPTCMTIKGGDDDDESWLNQTTLNENRQGTNRLKETKLKHLYSKMKINSFQSIVSERI